MITIRCPECNLKMKITDAVVSNPNSTTKCSICKKVFKAHELYKKQSGNKINLNGTPDIPVEREQENPAKKTEVLNSKKTAKAWIIIHDEAAPPQTYDLYIGVNNCGKEPVKSGNPVTIKSNDIYMSRKHFSIEVVDRYGRCEFILKDNESLNGTYIDTKVLEEFTRQMRPINKNEEIYIEDNALIEAGKTKIHFKVAENNNKEAEAKKIQNQKFTKTVIVNI